jgi:septal ring-binding cell division protein DamX
VIAAGVVWWGLDGRHRFASGPEEEPARDRVVASADQAPEGTEDSDTQDAVTQEPSDEVVDAVIEAEGERDIPEEDEDDAEQSVEPVDPARTGTPTAQGETISGPGGRYRVMISSHKRESDAGVEAAQLSRRGILTEVVAAEVADRGTWYRVVVSGGYPSHSMALEVLDTIKSLGYEGAWIERSAANE